MPRRGEVVRRIKPQYYRVDTRTRLTVMVRTMEHRDGNRERMRFRIYDPWIADRSGESYRSGGKWYVSDVLR